jgi:uncharacterized membrane protein
MDVLNSVFWSGLLSIIVIDLVLAGDNAIVIALAARNLPRHLQKQAIFWGTLGAIAGFRERMQNVVRDGIYQILKVQALTLLSLYTFVPSIFRLLGISALYTPLYMVQAVAASFQVMLLAVLNVFYYLDRRTEVVVITATLAVLNFALSAFSIRLGSEFFGYGFAVSILCTLFLGLLLLQGLFRKLEYQTFMLQ